ncbi:hypothetical protein T492DRAFT_1015886 [Pavlovales sp. CCMP2436]|nr:hypothetical protein T492DRAFT_1015886 [Pavlovales sp. CCMP2436]
MPVCRHPVFTLFIVLCVCMCFNFLRNLLLLVTPPPKRCFLICIHCFNISPLAVLAVPLYWMYTPFPQGVPSSGLHSNGFALVRKLVFDIAGLTWVSAATVKTKQNTKIVEHVTSKNVLNVYYNDYQIPTSLLFPFSALSK